MDNRVAIVTGASSGIGEATARRLQALGHTVYAAARRVDRMEGLRRDGIRVLRLDVTDDASMTAMVEQIVAETGRIDVLVNNAGYGSYGAVEDVPLEEARRQFDVNVFGLARLTQLVLPHMRARRDGRIVNISSIGGKIYEPLGGWYHATKFAVEGLSDSLRVEVAPFGIHVVLIEPGAIRTEWSGIAASGVLSTSGRTAYAEQARMIAGLLAGADTNPRLVSPPDVIARAVAKAVTARRPRTRYAVGGGAKPILLMRRMLTDRGFDRFIVAPARTVGRRSARAAAVPTPARLGGAPGRAPGRGRADTRRMGPRRGATKSPRFYYAPAVTSASAVLDTTEEAPPKPTRRGVAGVLLRVLPWLLPAAALVFGLHHTHTPARYIAVYAAYFAVVIVLPGTLVHRALRGSRGNLPEDLGLGAATGLLVLLIGWALCAATRTQELLPAWPLLVVAPFVVVPRLRRRVWRIPAEQRRPLPVAWSWIVAVALVVIVMINLPIWTVVPLPPATATYYQDLMYHLALIHEMTRSIPFQVPQLAGDTLRYHYLSDADMAAASMITKIPIPVVLFRLWIVPIEGLAIFVAAALGRRLTGKWWAGALAGVSSVLVIPLTLGSPQGASGGTPIQIYSPSQTYVLPLVGLLIMLAVDVLGGERLGRAWIMVFPLAVACAGAKSSALPPFVAGLLLAAVVVAVRARERLLATGAFLGLTVVAVYLGTKIFAGGGGSVLSLQPLAVLFWFAPYKKTLGVGDTNDGTLPLPLGVSHADTAGLLFIAGLVCWWLAMQAPRMLGIAALVTRRTRTEPAAWLLAGIGMSGGGAMWLLWHPASSQTYFFLCAAPFATMLTVWLLADLARGWRAVVAGLLAGALWAEFAPKVALPAHNTVRDWAWVLGLPLLRAAAAACAAAVTGLVTWRLVTGRLAWRAVPVALVAAVLGAGLAGRVDGESRSSYAALTKPPAKGNPGRAIHADEARAALWLDEHAGNDDVVATNVHCADLSWTAACDARAFWVAGLGGRRTLVESWAYTDQAVAANGVNGKGFALQPAPYPDRFALNQRVFAKGDQADVTRLKDEYHVKWLFADSRAQGGASPNLAKAATLRYTSGTVTVYEVR